MGLVIHLFKLFYTVVCVYLRCSQRRVPQQFLDRPDVGPAVEQVRGESVPQDVRAAFALYPRFAQQRVDDPVHFAAAYGVSLLR